MTSNHNSWLPTHFFRVTGGQFHSSHQNEEADKQWELQLHLCCSRDYRKGPGGWDHLRWNRPNVTNTFTTSVFFMSIFKMFWWPHYWADGGMGIRVFQKKILENWQVKLESFLPSYYWHPTLLQDGVAGIFFRGLSTRVSWCKFRLISNLRPRSCGNLWLFTVKLGAPQNWKNDTRHMYLIGWWHLKYVIVSLLFEFWFDLVSCGHY